VHLKIVLKDLPYRAIGCMSNKLENN
jgi:hypothetical protein